MELVLLEKVDLSNQLENLEIANLVSCKLFLPNEIFSLYYEVESLFFFLAQVGRKNVITLLLMVKNKLEKVGMLRVNSNGRNYTEAVELPLL